MRSKAAEVGWDETFQRCLFSTKMYSRDAEHAKRGDQGQKFTCELRHSMICTVLMKCVELSQSSVAEAWHHISAIVPPRCVKSTDHVSVGKSLFRGLDTYVFSGGLKGLVEGVKTTYMTILCVAMDAASANFPVFRVLAAYLNYLQYVHCAAATAVIVIHLELCACHQYNRIVVKVLKRFKLNRFLYGISKLMAQRNIRRQVREGARKYIDSVHFEWNELPPPFRRHESECRDRLSHMLRRRITGVYEAASAAGTRTAESATNQFFNFFFAKRNLKCAHLGHTCQANTCGMCGTKESATTKAKQFLDDCFFAMTPPRFLPSRWRKMLPSCLYWILFIICGQLAEQAFKNVNASNKNKDKNNGVRLNYVINTLQDPMTKCLMIALLVVLVLFEQIYEVLFRTAGLLTDFHHVHNAEYQKRNETRGQNRTAAYQCIDIHFVTMKEVWKAFKDTTGQSAFEVFRFFYPLANGDENDMNNMIQRTALTILGDMFWRFKYHRYPHCLYECEVIPKTDAKWIFHAKQIEVMHKCDLSDLLNFWQAKIKACSDDTAKGVLLAQLAAAFFRALRGVTLAEEHWHAFHRQTTSQPQSYPSQAADHVTELLRRNFEATGGRELSKPLPKICQYFKKVSRGNVKPRRTIYKRKNKKLDDANFAFAYGNALLTKRDRKLPPKARGKKMKIARQKWFSLPLVEQELCPWSNWSVRGTGCPPNELHPILLRCFFSLMPIGSEALTPKSVQCTPHDNEGRPSSLGKR